MAILCSICVWHAVICKLSTTFHWTDAYSLYIDRIVLGLLMSAYSLFHALCVLFVACIVSTRWNDNLISISNFVSSHTRYIVHIKVNNTCAATRSLPRNSHVRSVGTESAQNLEYYSRIYLYTPCHFSIFSGSCTCAAVHRTAKMCKDPKAQIHIVFTQHLNKGEGRLWPKSPSY